MSQRPRSTSVLVHPTEILAALVGLKDVRVLQYERRGPDVELMIEQILDTVRCPSCGERAQVKERPVVRYVDLPVYGVPMGLCWKKHRMRCVNGRCAKRTFLLQDHRIAAKKCLLTTRAAKWATVQVGCGRTVSEVAGELNCDWHTVNDAVTTYGTALLAADRKRLNQTTAIGLDETSFVRRSAHIHTNYATTVADVENHQIIDILPSRNYLDVAGWIDKKAMPPEIQRLGKTIRKWFDKLCNYHLAKVSNGPTEALNNLIKRIKRIGFGFRNFENYRIRALLYAGKPNWRVLGSIVVR